jgi:lysine-arginine-ornithine-binding protein
MKTWISCGVAAIALSAAAVAAGNTLSEPSANRSIKAGVQCTYPPFSYRDMSGQLKGFEIDVVSEVANRIQAKLQFVCLDFNGLIPALLAQKIDVIAASLSITEVRRNSIDFSIPYRASTARFLGERREGIQPFDADGKPDPAALKGKIVGVQRATTNDTYLAAVFPGVQISRYDSAENLLLDLTARRIDLALVGPLKVERDFLNQDAGKNYQFVGPEIESVQYFGSGVAFGLRKDAQALREAINAALQGMYDDGTFKAINQRYWSFSVLPSVWH